MYIETLFFLNFTFNFIILISLLLAINQKINIKRLIIASFVGSLLVGPLILNINKILLIILTIIVSIIMIIIINGLNNLLYNIFLLYFLSIFLGGYIYIIRKKLYLLIIPIILISHLFKKTKINKNYKIKMKINNKIKTLNAYLDTGNTLTYKGLPVIFTKYKIKGKINIIPYKTIDKINIIKAIKGKIKINNKIIDCYIAYTNKINYEVLLNNKMEEKC